MARDERNPHQHQELHRACVEIMVTFFIVTFRPLAVIGGRQTGQVMHRAGVAINRNTNCRTVLGCDWRKSTLDEE